MRIKLSRRHINKKGGKLVIILRKKRLVITANLIILALFACIYSVVANDPKATQTVALPVSGKVVILDAGHGLPDKRRYTEKII